MNIFVLLMSVFLAVPLFAQEKDPKAVVEEIFKGAGQEAVAVDENLQAEVSKHVDFDAMTRDAVAKTKVPAGELTWFQTTLKEIITRTVFPEAPGFLKNVSITYKAVEINGDNATVHSIVKRKAELTDVSYKFKKHSQSSWRVVDISIDGESWVGNIRDQVNTTLKKKSWKGLKESLNKRLTKLRQVKKA